MQDKGCEIRHRLLEGESRTVLRPGMPGMPVPLRRHRWLARELPGPGPAAGSPCGERCRAGISRECPRSSRRQGGSAAAVLGVGMLVLRSSVFSECSCAGFRRVAGHSVSLLPAPVPKPCPWPGEKEGKGLCLPSTLLAVSVNKGFFPLWRWGNHFRLFYKQRCRSDSK